MHCSPCVSHDDSFDDTKNVGVSKCVRQQEDLARTVDILSSTVTGEFAGLGILSPVELVAKHKELQERSKRTTRLKEQQEKVYI